MKSFLHFCTKFAETFPMALIQCQRCGIKYRNEWIYKDCMGSFLPIQW